jgi:hypothetical protein
MVGVALADGGGASEGKDICKVTNSVKIAAEDFSAIPCVNRIAGYEVKPGRYYRASEKDGFIFMAIEARIAEGDRAASTEVADAE